MLRYASTRRAGKRGAVEPSGKPLCGCGQILRGFAHVLGIGRHRQLKHSNVLAFTQPREQHYLSTRKFHRISMSVLTLIQMPHTCNAVRKFFSWEKGE